MSNLNYCYQEVAQISEEVDLRPADEWMRTEARAEAETR